MYAHLLSQVCDSLNSEVGVHCNGLQQWCSGACSKATNSQDLGAVGRRGILLHSVNASELGQLERGTHTSKTPISLVVLSSYTSCPTSPLLCEFLGFPGLFAALRHTEEEEKEYVHSPSAVRPSEMEERIYMITWGSRLAIKFMWSWVRTSSKE